MLVHPQFDPVALHVGPVAVHWYGLMYLVGFALFLLLGRLRSRDGWRGMTADDVEDLLFYGVVGVAVAWGSVFFISRHGICRIRWMFSKFGRAA